MLKALSANERLCLAATIDRLIYGDATTFDPADAAELLRLAPPMTFLSVVSTFVSFSAHSTGEGRETEGYAAGIGNVTVNDRTEAFSFDSRGRSLLRVGQWKLHNNTGLFQRWCGIVWLEIEQVAADGSKDGRVVRMRYRSGQATRMFLMTIMPILALANFRIQCPLFLRWKVPATKTLRPRDADLE
jgi:hypothetical protein